MVKLAIAIDGPAGSGKSTAARQVAEKLKITYVDTGAMYRAVAYYCISHGFNTEDEAQVNGVLDQIDLKIVPIEGVQRIYINQEDVTELVRMPEVGKGASDVAQYGAVRQRLVEMQRSMAEQGSVVMDGRDIGTNVLPHAQVKIYLEASAEERAKRRLEELALLGKAADAKEIEEQIRARDYQDEHRKINPLCKAADAQVIDTTHMSIEEMVQEILWTIQIKVG